VLSTTAGGSEVATGDSNTAVAAQVVKAASMRALRFISLSDGKRREVLRGASCALYDEVCGEITWYILSREKAARSKEN
jgi:hypothetical protein